MKRALLSLALLAAVHPAPAAATPDSACGWRWSPAVIDGPVIPPMGPFSVWTGREIFSLGRAGGSLYEPETRSFRPIPDPPIELDWQASAWWTGREVLIWSSPEAGGALFDPGTATWRAISRENGPAYRSQMTVAWARTRLFVFGGFDRSTSSFPPATGGWLYDPEVDRWENLSAPPAHEPTGYEVAALDGRTLYVGYRQLFALDTGDWSWRTLVPANAGSFRSIVSFAGKLLLGSTVYDPGSGTFARAELPDGWGRHYLAAGDRLLSTPYSYSLGIPGAPAQISNAFHVLADPAESPWFWRWTRVASDPIAELGRFDFAIVPAGDGRLFALDLVHGHVHTLDLRTLRWRTPDRQLSPFRTDASVTRAGEEWLLFGGLESGDAPDLADGYRFDPAAGRLVAMGTASADPPTPRSGHVAVFTGEELVVYGGVRHATWPPAPVDDAYAWSRSTDRWRRIPFDGPPPAALPGAVGFWTGSDVLIFGVAADGGKANGGFRFDPVSGRWRRIPADGAPAAGTRVATAWDGRRLAVLAADGESAGAIYDATTDRWTELPSDGKPSRRVGAAALWDGDRLIVYGGSDPDATPYPRNRLDGAACDLAAYRWIPLDRPRPDWPAWLGISSPRFVAVGREAWVAGPELALDLDSLQWADRQPLGVSVLLGGRGAVVPDGRGALAFGAHSIARVDPFGGPPGEIRLTSPKPGETGVVEPRFRWDPVENALRRELRFGRSGAALATVPDFSVPREILVPDTDYYWQVVASNDCGLVRESEIRRFRTAPFASRIFRRDDAALRPFETVWLSDVGSGRPTAWRWDFGDGTTGEGRQVSHHFTDPGHYRVRLDSESPDGPSHAEITIFVGGEPEFSSSRRFWIDPAEAPAGSTSRLRLLLPNATDRKAVVRLRYSSPDGTTIDRTIREVTLAARETLVLDDLAAEFPGGARGGLFEARWPGNVSIPWFGWYETDSACGTLRSRVVEGGSWSYGANVEPPFGGELWLRNEGDRAATARVTLWAGARAAFREIELPPHTSRREADLASWFDGEPPEAYAVRGEGSLFGVVVERDAASGQLVRGTKSWGRLPRTFRDSAWGRGSDGVRRDARVEIPASSREDTVRILFRHPDGTIGGRADLFLTAGESRVVPGLAAEFFPSLAGEPGSIELDARFGESVTSTALVEGSCGPLVGALPESSGARLFVGVAGDEERKTVVFLRSDEDRDVLLRLRSAEGSLLAERSVPLRAGVDTFFDDVVAQLSGAPLLDGSLEVAAPSAGPLHSAALLVDRRSGSSLQLGGWY